MRHPLRHGLALGLAALCAGCFEPDFFDELPTGGGAPFPGDSAPPRSDGGPSGPDGGAGGGAPDPEGPLAPEGPACLERCQGVVLVGARAVTDLVADGSGGGFALVEGGLTAVVDFNGEMPVEAGQSHLVLLGASGSVDRVFALPFTGTGLAWGRTGLFVTGYGFQEGTILGTAVALPEPRSIVFRMGSTHTLEWFVTWPSPRPSRVAADESDRVFVASGPADMALYRNADVAPLHDASAAGTGAGSFVVRLDGGGSVEWFQPVGGARTDVDRLAAGPDGAMALSGTGDAVTLWNGADLGAARFLAGVGPAGDISWAFGWDLAAVSVGDLAVDARRSTWATLQVRDAAADLSPLTVDLPPGAGWRGVVARISANGASTRAIAPEAGDVQSAVLGVALDRDAVYVVGEVGGSTPFLFAGLRGRPGVFVARLDGEGPATWLRTIQRDTGGATAESWLTAREDWLHLGGVFRGPVTWGAFTHGPAVQHLSLLKIIPP